MNDDDRFHLLLGSYETPPFRYGDRVLCERLGWCVVTGMSDGPIPWPMGRPLYRSRGRASVLLVSTLVNAVLHESEVAVAHWWGVSHDVAWKMRKALNVPEFNEGTRRLKGEVAREPASVEARAVGVRRVGPDPERRAKIAAAKRGKPRPRHVVEAIIAAHLGTHHTDGARAKMSEAHRLRGTRPPKAGRAWTTEEDDLVRTLPPAEVAARTRRTLAAVYVRRIVLRMPDGRTRESKRDKGR